MSKKKILHLITGLEVGGAEMMLLKTLPRMQEAFDNRICCIRGHGEIGKRLEAASVPVYYLDLKNIFDLGIIFRFGKIIKEFEPDILVTYLIHADLFGRVFGRIFGIKKIICSVRVKLIQWKYLPLLALDGLTSFLVNHYHFNSHTVADMYLKYFFLSNKKITVIPNGIEIAKYKISIDKMKKRRELSIPEDVFLIGCVGRLEKQKGQKYLIGAFSEIIKTHPQVFLILIGDGSYRIFLEKLAQTLELGNCVKFFGRRSDVPEILQTIDLFVLPSLYEGMSNAVMEAMAAGKPIITTHIPENKELIQNNQTGILVSPKNTLALKLAMENIIENSELKKLLGDEAQKSVSKNFIIEAIINRFQRFYISQ